MTEYRRSSSDRNGKQRQHSTSPATYHRDANRYQSRPQTRSGSSSRQRPAHSAYSPAHSRQTRKQQPRPKLPIVFALILLSILVICAVWFIACSNTSSHQDEQPSSAGTSTASSSSSSSSSSTNDSALTTNEQNRALTSSSANDVKPTKKVVYLTFDDGPSEYTHKILDTLDKYGIKATWFILGNTGHIDYVKDIWDRGNQIGLHSQEHDYNKIYANTDNFVADIQGIGKVVSSYIGFTPTLIRFPGGSNNGYNAGKADSFKKAAAAQGWHYFDWNVSIGDSTQTPSDPDVLFNNIVEESQGCNSCCVLMHDSDFKPTTPDALPRIIEYYQSQGFTFDVLAADSYGYHF